MLRSHTRLQTLLPPGTNEPPNLDLSILMDLPANGSSTQRPLSPLRSKSPDAELAALVTAIQATNGRVREVNTLMEDTTSNIAHLQVRRPHANTRSRACLWCCPGGLTLALLCQ